MRVIAGSAKGTRLATVPPGVRPVSDRAREGLFSSLGERVIGADVLDLFAGTGALGVEALSRGAASATFVDRAPRSIAVVRENVRRAKVSDRAEVIRLDVGRFLERPPERSFDLVFVDPPYAVPDVEVGRVLERLRAPRVLADDATVLLTRDLRSSIDVIRVNWAVAKRLVYGDSVVTLFRSQPHTMEE